jgi:hypothetical protein
VDEKEELEKKANAVETTLKTTGWKNVIQPALLQLRATEMSKLFVAHKLEEFLEVKSNVGAIDWLLSFVEGTVAMKPSEQPKEDSELEY